MIRIKFLLRQPTRPGVKAVYATVRYKNQTVILYPGISIHTDAWLRKNGHNKPKDIPENYDLIDFLNDFAKLLRETYKELLALACNSIVSPDLFKKAVYAKHLGEQVEKVLTPKKEKRVSISDFLQTFIDDSKNKVRFGQNGKVIMSSTIATYETCKKHFIDFQNKYARKYYLTDLDQKLIDAFNTYLVKDLNLSGNGVGKHMKTLKSALNYARHQKLIAADSMLGVKIKITRESPDNIYLSRKDISDLMSINDFETPLYELVRDLFVLGCLTGFRFSDISTMEKAVLEDELIYKTIEKSQVPGIIPIHPIVRQILDKYPNGFPQCPPNQVFNRYLKDIGKKLPQLNTDFVKVITRGGVTQQIKYKKYQLLQTHTARRSFATNEYLSGTPTITIRKITGHKTDEFLKYIKADNVQHARLMAKNWKQRREDEDDMESVGV